MPNWCSNNVTIKNIDSELIDAIENFESEE